MPLWTENSFLRLYHVFGPGGVHFCTWIHKFHVTSSVQLEGAGNNIKIMPYVEGDRSDCQPKASSTSASGNDCCRGLTI